MLGSGISGYRNCRCAWHAYDRTLRVSFMGRDAWRRALTRTKAHSRRFNRFRSVGTVGRDAIHIAPAVIRASSIVTPIIPIHSFSISSPPLLQLITVAYLWFHLIRSTFLPCIAIRSSRRVRRQV